MIFRFSGGLIVVQNGRPIDVQVSVQRGDQQEPAEEPKTILALRLIAKPPANGLDLFHSAESRYRG